jgi:hypothetical protein
MRWGHRALLTLQWERQMQELRWGRSLEGDQFRRHVVLCELPRLRQKWQVQGLRGEGEGQGKMHRMLRRRTIRHVLVMRGDRA